MTAAIALPAYWSERLLRSLNLPEVNQPKSLEPFEAAKICFHPDKSGYEARKARRSQVEGLPTSVPHGWPQRLSGPLVWRGTDYENDEQYVFNLNAREIEEISHALGTVNSQGLRYDDIAAATFPLPTLGIKLRQLRTQVYEGIGFVILRGLDVDQYSGEDCFKLFLGISSYIAPQRGPQDEAGNKLMHLIDYGRVDSARELPIHTDMAADVVATMALRCSDFGGEGTVSSSWKVYNEMAATRPDLIHTLAEPNWPMDTYGRVPSYYTRALLFHNDDGKVIFNFSRRVLTGHPFSGRTSGIPGLTDAQAEALDAVHFLAQKHKLVMTTKKGDMRFINNFAVLHGREAYGDNDARKMEADLETDECRSHRHLLRLWLHDQDMAWKLPPSLQLVWGRGFGDHDRHCVWNEAQWLIENRWRATGPKPAQPCD